MSTLVLKLIFMRITPANTREAEISVNALMYSFLIEL